MDTLTLMIVDILGVLAHQSEEAQSWQKITVKELKPSASSPHRCLIGTTDKEKKFQIFTCWLIIMLMPGCV